MLTIIEDTTHATSPTAAEQTFSIRSHNGTVTALNPATGQHRTFRIRTQPDDADFMPRKRIISLLTGPDNERDFTSFGFVGGDGSIHVWYKKRGTQFEKLARFLERADWFAGNQGFTFTWSAKCRRCNRELTTPESLASGLGPICREIVDW